ncbi:hypothetical protein CC1G_15114 [Coprinopsis cinerea okayama7|uniref:Uncharacterized protein n=1 Tax=Coprinopsis cinerea (strain Okayama-7 / 130 / ATCC MYA-4618 / FGSC 9003) TaxID=240176 RepID=D6RPK4_COPC7|nr:hypothetical protein CC1G_15114 [Coprinopsis cinerea okayama7\|eukprot:XP_002910473.1 hypothetical protein CC1G_15114 [Coprinopsis cinerea okayama7\
MPKPLSYATLSPDEWESFHEFLSVRLQLAFTAFARDETGRLWKACRTQFTEEFLQALHFVGLSRMFHAGLSIGRFTAKLIEDWDVMFDEVEQGRMPDFSRAEGWVMDSQAFHEAMPLAWWKDVAADPAASGTPYDDSAAMSAWMSYCNYLRSRVPPVGYMEDYADALTFCVQDLAGYPDGAADMLDHTAQQVIPALQEAVNRISDICLYPLYLDWYKIGNRQATQTRRRENLAK